MTPFISNLFNLPVTRKEILERAKQICKKKERCLCTTILCVLRDYGIGCFFISEIVEIIPEFTRANAIPFGADEIDIFWWQPGVWDTGRMDFLNWLIEEYKNDKTNLRKL